MDGQVEGGEEAAETKSEQPDEIALLTNLTSELGTLKKLKRYADANGGILGSAAVSLDWDAGARTEHHGEMRTAATDIVKANLPTLVSQAVKDQQAKVDQARTALAAAQASATPAAPRPEPQPAAPVNVYRSPNETAAAAAPERRRGW